MPKMKRTIALATSYIRNFEVTVSWCEMWMIEGGSFRFYTGKTIVFR